MLFKYLLLCFFIQSLLPIAHAQKSLKEGLLAYYPFDGDATDGREERNDGYVNRIKPTEDRFNKPHKAIYVEGGGVEIYNVSIPVKSATICLWVKPSMESNLGKQNILSKHYSYANCELLIRIRPDGFYSAEWNIGATYFDISKEDKAKLFKPTYTQYDFLLLKYDGSKVEFYVNNKLSARKFIKGEIVNNNKPISVGSLSKFPKREVFKGAVDDLRIYNRALTTSEITQLFQLKE